MLLIIIISSYGLFATYNYCFFFLSFFLHRKIILIVHGFPNNILALQFEWTWQHPKESRHLKNIQSLFRRKNLESYFEYNFRILCEMFRIGPWKRLPLVIRWLSPEFVRPFPVSNL